MNNPIGIRAEIIYFDFDMVEDSKKVTAINLGSKPEILMAKR